MINCSQLGCGESSEIKPLLKESSEKNRKVRHLLAKKIFKSDSRNDLGYLLTLDIEELFEKYEETSRPKKAAQIKMEDLTGMAEAETILPNQLTLFQPRGADYTPNEL